jgi:hypothetical protein
MIWINCKDAGQFGHDEQPGGTPRKFKGFF